MLKKASYFGRYVDLVPRELEGNLEYRRAITRACLESEEARHEFWIRCRRDVLYAFNALFWTYDPRRRCPTVPFVLYPYQEEALERLDDSFGKADVLIEKSRDMGASWLCLGYIYHRWLFYPYQSMLLGSRKEEYVDKLGDWKSLFGKLDFLIRFTPRWMAPQYTRNKLHLRNETNGSRVDGESTNSDFGRGDRRTAVFLDEFAAVDNGHEVQAATRDVTLCRIYNSTPKGLNAFSQKRDAMREFSPENVITMHWSSHPEKRAGLYSSMADRVQIRDETYEFPDNYPFILDGKIRSPWYDLQCRRAASKQEIAQELDIDYARSGWMFFDADAIAMIKERDVRVPAARGELIYDADDHRVPVTFSPSERGRLLLWVELDAEDAFTRFEPFVIGCDISTGKGGSRTSNSCGSVMGLKTGKKVAEFVCSDTPPIDFADYMMALCRWFHGPLDKKPGFLIWEDNGPGVQFGKRVVQKRHSPFYYRRNETAVKAKRQNTPGFYTTRQTKTMVLGQYGRALKMGDMRNPSEPALDECLEYVHQPTGDIVHSKAQAQKKVDPTSAGENHGDRVIADALCWHGRIAASGATAAQNVLEDPKSPTHIPRGSMAYRLEMSKRRQEDLVWV